MTTQSIQIPSLAVDVWPVSLKTNHPALLSVAEQERASRFRFERDRQCWAQARSALRRVLSRYTGRPPLELDFRMGEHGKPALADARPYFNLSHSGDWALIAVCMQSPVGVDIELIRDGVEIAALLRRLGETDLPFLRDACFQRWARREARSKATGGPLMAPLDSNIFAEDLDVIPGPHDQPWLREVGTLAALLWHDANA